MSAWEVRMSHSRGVHYFHNPTTQESRWDPPVGLSEAEIQQLPGAAKYIGSASAPSKVRASHLLVKHLESRRPSSWKEAKITRSKSEAIDILRGYQTEIGGDADKFAELASVHSDCSSHEKGGDLGWFSRGQMQKPFEDATYSLDVGQMSDIIATDSGVHVVLRTG